MSLWAKLLTREKPEKSRKDSTLPDEVTTDISTLKFKGDLACHAWKPLPSEEILIGINTEYH